MTETISRPRARSRRPRRGAERVVHVIGLVGRAFVAAGLLLLFFTAYLLWGTGVYTHEQQKSGRAALVRAPVVDQSGLAEGNIPPARPARTPHLGDPLFELRIPKIALDTVVVYGVGLDQLKKGPGLWPDCRDVPPGNDCTNGAVYPGEHGNVAVSGHRTTYGAPFWNTNELQPGDTIDFISGRARYRYRVRNQEIVDPVAGYSVVTQHGRDELTLTSCHPRFSATQRLIIHADYVGASLVGEGDAKGRRTPETESRPILTPDVLLLAGVALASALGSLGLSRRYARLAGYAALVLVAGIGLWVVAFPHVVRLLPAQY